VRIAGSLLDAGQVEQARERFQFTRETTHRFEETLGALFGLAICDYLDDKSGAALDKLRLCIKRHEISSLKLPVPEAKTGMLSDRIGFYNLAATIFAEQYERDGSEPSIDSVFHYLERSKAQALRDMLGAEPTLMHSSLVEPLLERISRIDNELLLGTGDSLALNAEMFKLEDSLQRMRFALTSQSESPALDAFSTIMDLDSVKHEYLKPGDLLLEYLVSAFGCFLILATNEAVTLQRLDTDLHQIGNDVGELIAHINKYPETPTPSEKYIDVCRRLGRLLIPTGVLQLQQTRRLLVIPDGPLYRLPFETLVTEGGRYLIEDFDLCYASSMTVLEVVAARPIRPPGFGDVVVYADPATDSTVIASLAASRNEIVALEGAFGVNRVDAFWGANASKARFRSHDYTSTRYLHIATHGVTDERHIERSALVLANGEGQGSSLLQVAEIAAMNIPVDLVFLSACSTGTGVSLPGEGVMSLAQPFLVAGARSVIATDWNVDDRGATEFVRGFYSQLAAGGSKLHSLAQAKREFLASDIMLYRHPFFWAPWRLVGAYD
jgi:hypothetical protein